MLPLPTVAAFSVGVGMIPFPPALRVRRGRVAFPAEPPSLAPNAEDTGGGGVSPLERPVVRVIGWHDFAPGPPRTTGTSRPRGSGLRGSVGGRPSAPPSRVSNPRRRRRRLAAAEAARGTSRRCPAPSRSTAATARRPGSPLLSPAGGSGALSGRSTVDPNLDLRDDHRPGLRSNDDGTRTTSPPPPRTPSGRRTCSLERTTRAGCARRRRCSRPRTSAAARRAPPTP